MATYEKVNKLQELKVRLKGMTWKERLDYLWEYYKWVAIVAVIAILLTVSVVNSIVESNKNLLYGGAAVNVNVSEEGIAYLTDGWLAQRQGRAEKDKVELAFLNLYLDEKIYAEMATANATRLAAMITNADIDYLLLDAKGLQYCANIGAFAPLDTTISQETLDKLEGKIITLVNETQQYQAAIDISDLPFVKKHISTSDKVYIAFPGNTTRTEWNETFLEYLINWSE